MSIFLVFCWCCLCCYPLVDKKLSCDIAGLTELNVFEFRDPICIIKINIVHFCLMLVKKEVAINILPYWTCRCCWLRGIHAWMGAFFQE